MKITRKWIAPGMQQPMPDTTRPAVPIPEIPTGSQLKDICPMCGQEIVNCGCGKPSYGRPM